MMIPKAHQGCLTFKPTGQPHIAQRSTPSMFLSRSNIAGGNSQKMLQTVKLKMLDVGTLDVASRPLPLCISDPHH